MRNPSLHYSISTLSRKRRLMLVATVKALALCATSLIGCFQAAHAADETEKPYPSTLSGGAPCGSCVAPAELSWRTVIPPPNEPGEPLEITGTIYLADGVTPAKDHVLFVYHTDVTGYYNKQDDASHPRLRGWMKTDADGHYAFRTIKPGAYPHRATPAHIHAHVYGPNYSERSIDDYWFEGDPRINAEVRAHAVIIALKRNSEGIWRGVRDIRLKRD